MKLVRIGLSPKLSKVIPGYFDSIPMTSGITMTLVLIEEQEFVSPVNEGSIRPRYVSTVGDAIRSLITLNDLYDDIENSMSSHDLFQLLQEVEHDQKIVSSS